MVKVVSEEIKVIKAFEFLFSVYVSGVLFIGFCTVLILRYILT